MLLVNLLHDSPTTQLCTLLSDGEVGNEILLRLQDAAPDLLLRAALEGDLAIDTYVGVIMAMLPRLDPPRAADVSRAALTRCLRERFRGDEVGVIAMLIASVGEELDGARIAWLGLGPAVEASAVSRNMLAFDRAPQPARMRLVSAVDEIALALADRHIVQLDVPAAEACARLLIDAESQAARALLTASGTLLPTLMRSRREPISSMVAALFPILYRELAKVDDVPDLLKLIPFLDWDRCKAARHELVSAFISSPAWRPGDLALTACRCADVGKILRRTAKSYGGDAYLGRVDADLDLLPLPCRSQIVHEIYNIRSDWPIEYDWRD
jgi:hypothetical protein